MPPRSDNILLELQDINKSFRTKHIQTNALKNIFLKINKGDFLAITGPSGGGKSTLLSVLSLLDKPDSGAYLYQNKPLGNLSFDQMAAFRNRKFGIIFQAYNLVGDLTVSQNIALPLKYSTSIPKQNWTKLVSNALHSVDLMPRAHHYPAQLSGGQQQRASIARALVTSPSVIFADEPTGNLDSENKNQIISLFRKLNEEGITICMVTHDLEIAEQCRRQLVIRDGALFD